MKYAVLLLALLLRVLICCAQTSTVCPDLRYSLRQGTSSCYLYYDIEEDYFAANRSCIRDGAVLVFIEDTAENNYIYQTYYMRRGQAEFWIGLNDLHSEGIFRWENSSVNSQALYQNWTGGEPENTLSWDCASIISTGWRVHPGFCSTATLPHLCKMNSCMSTDGRNCIGAEPTTQTGSSVSAVVIIIPIVIVIIIIIVIVVVVVLLCLWKFNNDVFQRYCCCCLGRSSKSAIHSMQQENQRLRHELSQHKVSLSGRFQPGQLMGERELSGVPDGKGGVLPTIKQHGVQLSPTATESRLPGTEREAMPPLVVQQPTTTTIPHVFTKHNSLSHLSSTGMRPTRVSLPGSFGRMPSIPPPEHKGVKANLVEESLSESGSESEQDNK